MGEISTGTPYWIPDTLDQPLALLGLALLDNLVGKKKYRF